MRCDVLLARASQRASLDGARHIAAEETSEAGAGWNKRACTFGKGADWVQLLAVGAFANGAE